MSKLSREELQYELVNSKKILEKILKNKITDFAFPFGTNNEVSEREINELNNSDYTSAVTTYNSPIMKGCNFYSLPRVGIDKSINHKNIFGIFSRYSYLLKGISKYLKL